MESVMEKKYIVTAKLPKDFDHENLGFSIHDGHGEDYSKNIQEIEPTPKHEILNSMTNLNHQAALENLIDPDKPNIVDTVFTQSIYYDEKGEILWESNCSSEKEGTQVGVYARMIDGTLYHIADFLKKEEADNFASFLIKFSTKVRYPKA